MRQGAPLCYAARTEARMDGAAAIWRWCLTEGRLAPTMEAVLAGFCAEVQAAGVPLRRFNITIPTLHPLIVAENWIWKGPGQPMEANRFAQGDGARNGFLFSPIHPIVEGRERFVRYPIPAGGPWDFPLFELYSSAGMTDYVAWGLPGTLRRPLALSAMTDAPGGWSAELLALLEAALLGLRPLLDLHIERTIARSVCATYIGTYTGPRVLDGAIFRGSVESLQAVVWFCDLRGFTPLTLALGADGVVDVLNAFFSAVGEPIEAAGGEILKFIGDAALAVFPVRDGHGPAAACEAARRATAEAITALDALNTARSAAGRPRLDAGIALHIGEVSYGNIGASARLDFTVIGPAVNLAARLEGLAGRLGERVLMSGAFVEAGGGPGRALGPYALKGIEGEVDVYGW